MNHSLKMHHKHHCFHITSLFSHHTQKAHHLLHEREEQHEDRQQQQHDDRRHHDGRTRHRVHRLADRHNARVRHLYHHTPSPRPPRPWYRMPHCKKYFSRALVCLNTSVVRQLTAAFIESICFATPHAPRPRPHSRSNSTQFTTSRTELSRVTTTRSCRIFTRFTSRRATPHTPHPPTPFSVWTVFFTAGTTTVSASGDARLPRQYKS